MARARWRDECCCYRRLLLLSPPPRRQMLTRGLLQIPTRIDGPNSRQIVSPVQELLCAPVPKCRASGRTDPPTAAHHAPFTRRDCLLSIDAMVSNGYPMPDRDAGFVFTPAVPDNQADLDTAPMYALDCEMVCVARCRNTRRAATHRGAPCGVRDAPCFDGGSASRPAGSSKWRAAHLSTNSGASCSTSWWCPASRCTTTTRATAALRPSSSARPP